MVAVHGVNGVPEPKSDRTSRVRNGGDASARESSGSTSAAPAKDDVSISSEAQAAAEVIQLVQVAKTQDDIRAERVEAAREAIERGDYKNPEVVAKVAEKIIKHVT